MNYINMFAKKNFTNDEMEFIIKNLQRKEEAYDKEKTHSYDSMDHTPCTTTNSQNRDETVK